MSAGWYNRPPLEEFTQADWYDAKRNLSPSAYGRLQGQAKKAGLIGNKDPFTAYLETPGETTQHMRSLNTEAVKSFNTTVQDWGRKVRSELRSSVKASVKKDTQLSSSIRVSYRLKRGELCAIGFSFAREGAWIHYGAGKGYGGDGSRTQWYDRNGNVRQANRDSLYKAGTGARKQINWFNPVIEANIEELADIVANYSSTIALNLSNIYMH